MEGMADRNCPNSDTAVGEPVRDAGGAKITTFFASPVQPDTVML
jgi:hypothetical protein